ncbi:discoidin domain-containing protein [Duganella flavida]|uniref:discoidin domain-containing protein n=1 Tax=Duganella flavida TaxID=2692175 RepID=UPI001E4B888F|nr:discoidin domain-containing protein [Duganella flavida]
MKRYLLAASIAALVSLSSAAHATNAAAGLPSASYSDSVDWNGLNAESLFNGASWNAGTGGPQWVQVDLLDTKQITAISYLTNQLPDGHSWQKIFISNTAIGDNWTSLTPSLTFEGDTVANTPISFSFGAISGRYVEIVAYNEGSWTALQTASITAVPEPETYAMMLAGLGLVGAIARRRKAA